MTPVLVPDGAVPWARLRERFLAASAELPAQLRDFVLARLGDTPPTHEVRVGPSPMGGLGVFAVRAIRAGEIVRELRLGRRITRDAPPRPEQGERLEHCTLVDGRLHLLDSPDRHFNHRDPNVWPLRGPDEVVARRDVAAGAELVLDYLINNPRDSWRACCAAVAQHRAQLLRAARSCDASTSRCWRPGSEPPRP
jgi:hypothetical protein